MKVRDSWAVDIMDKVTLLCPFCEHIEHYDDTDNMIEHVRKVHGDEELK